jgi:predicted transcriptional regulator of viral defense system
MKSKNLLKQLNNLPYFDKKTICVLGEQLGLKQETINVYISRFLKQKEILSLKKGLYISCKFFNENKRDTSYLFYLANISRKPSYITSWTALQYYNLTTEAIHLITSATLKKTKEQQNKIGNFNYHSINKRWFSDFVCVKNNFPFFIASPSKALFDLLYFRTNQFKGIAKEDINILIEELRIDFDEMDKKEIKKFNKMINNIYE